MKFGTQSTLVVYLSVSLARFQSGMEAINGCQ